jgi:hypothetical protein
MEDWDADCTDVQSCSAAATSQPSIPTSLLGTEQGNHEPDALNYDLPKELSSLTFDQTNSEDGEQQQPTCSHHHQYSLVADSKNKVYVSNISYRV